MVEQNEIVPSDEADDFDEELSLEFDASHDPDAVWEWDGQSWVVVATA